MHIKLLITTPLLIFSHSVMGQATINTSGISDSNSVAKTRVNFVIKVPTKLSLSIKNGQLTTQSNTGNLYINTLQNTNNSFISENNVIVQQRTRAASYIVASP